MELLSEMQKPMTDYEEFKLPDSSFLNLKSEAKQQVEATLQTANNTKQQIYKTEQLIDLANKAEQRAIGAEEKAEEALSTAGLANIIAIAAVFVAGAFSVVSIILTLALNI